MIRRPPLDAWGRIRLCASTENDSGALGSPSPESRAPRPHSASEPPGWESEGREGKPARVELSVGWRQNRAIFEHADICDIDTVADHGESIRVATHRDRTGHFSALGVHHDDAEVGDVGAVDARRRRRSQHIHGVAVAEGTAVQGAVQGDGLRPLLRATSTT